jgi:HSP20 family protein
MSDDKNVMLFRDSENRASADFRSVQRLLESVFGETPVFGFRTAPGQEGLGWTPAVDIRETENELVVYAATPGLSKEDVSLEVKDNTLVLSGRMKGRGSDEDSWVRRELPRGEFYRAFSLPADVKADKVSAAMRDGILEIRLPKAEEARPRRISIG